MDLGHTSHTHVLITFSSQQPVKRYTDQDLVTAVACKPTILMNMPRYIETDYDCLLRVFLHIELPVKGNGP